MTTSGASNTFCKVCLVLLSLTLREGEKTSIGGFMLNMLKKLNGLRFTLPSLSTELTKAIGRGATVPCKKACTFGTGILFGSIVIISSFRLQVIFFRCIHQNQCALPPSQHGLLKSMYLRLPETFDENHPPDATAFDHSK